MKLSDFKYFLITLIIGLAISFFLYQTEYNQHQHFKRERFNQLVNSRFIAIENQLQQSFSAVKALSAFFTASTFVSRDEFRVFSHTLLQEHPEIHALEWVPVVSFNERINYEEGVRKEGFQQFTIHENSGNNQFVTAKNRSMYYPVHYVEPFEGNEKAFGYDLGSNEIRLKALLLAINQNRIVITEPIILVQEKQQQQAILVVQPLFKKPETVDELQQDLDLEGYVIMVMRMTDFYHYVEKTVFQKQEISIAIIDEHTKQWIAGSKKTHSTEQGLYHKKLKIVVGGRSWQLLASAPVDFLGYSADTQAYTVLLFSLIYSFLLALFVYVLKRQNTIIYSKVQSRTKSLQESQACYKAVIDTAVDSIISINTQGLISQFNCSAEKLWGYQAEEVLGKNVSMLMGNDHAPQHDTYIANYLKTGIKKIIGSSREVSAKHKDGHLIPVHLSVSDTGAKGDKRFTGIIRNLSEINATKQELHRYQVHLENLVLERTQALEQANKQLKILTEIDPLTNIANRRVYEDRLANDIARAKRSSQSLALMMIDIDFFKNFNDHYGHDAGDQALTNVAQTIQKSLVRETDLVARFGGEEFAVLMPSTDSQGALVVAEHIRNNIEILAIQHQYATAFKVVTVSIGVSSLQGDELNQVDLLQQADLALYVAKDKGRNRCEVYSAKVGEK